MPFSRKFMKRMGFPRVGDAVDGFNVESVSVEHEYIKGSKPRRYEYPTEIIVNGKGSAKDVESAFTQLFNQKDVRLLSGYGNLYLCNTGDMEISQLDETKYLIEARGHCVRTPRVERAKGSVTEGNDLRKLALSVYDAFFKGEGVVEVDRTFYTIGRTSQADVKYVKIDGFSFIEQNPEKASRWGEKAREGHKIMWVTKGRRYVAQVIDGRFLYLGKKKKA